MVPGESIFRQREDFSVPDDIDGAHLLHLNTERPLAELLASVDTSLPRCMPQ